MKAVIGVDSEGVYRKGLDLFDRIGFAKPRAEFVHVELPQLIYPPEAFCCVPEFEDARLHRAQDVLDEAVKEACARGMEASSNLMVGPPAESLIDRADFVDADLIVIGSTEKSKYGSFFLGSIGRGLTIGAKQSVLIGKGHPMSDGRLKAVMTTDHSAYCNQAIDMLMRFAPTGLQVTVLTAVKPANVHVSAIASGEAVQLHQRTMACSELVAERLRAAGIPADYRVVEGHVPDVIEASMKETNADLLIMAAHGHGFLERCLVGSMSLQQVVATNHSILLLRPRKR